MVTIIENKACIKGVIKHVSESADPRDFHQISVALQNSFEMDGYPNLAKADEGREIKIKVQKSFLDEKNLKPGDEVELPVRKAFGQIYFVQH